MVNISFAMLANSQRLIVIIVAHTMIASEMVKSMRINCLNDKLIHPFMVFVEESFLDE